MKRCLILLLALAALAAAEANRGTVIVSLTGNLRLRPSEPLFGGGDPSLHEATMRLKEALNGPEPRVVLDLTRDFEAGIASAEELAALLRTRPEGKKVLCLMDGVGNAGPVIAAACDEVLMAESGLLAVNGIALDSWYLAPALSKLGVRFHAVASGPWKTAPEMLTADGPSAAARQELHDLATGLDQALVALSLRPGLDAAGLAKARALAPQPGMVARGAGLVGTLVEPGAWLGAQPRPVRRLLDGADAPDLTSISGLMHFWSRLISGDEGPRAARAVAVVEMEGSIRMGERSMPGESICPDDTCALLARLAEDRRIVAVVLRIDSPGGDAGASDRIHHAVRRLDQVKPVIALFDGVAASGGYYIGCAAREIQVHRTTITGSIGVFALVPDLDGTLGLLGVRRHVEAVAPRADVLAPFGWNEDKRVAYLGLVQDIDRRFQGLVASRRKLPAEKVADLAGGKVYTGEQAVENKLADGFGTLFTAVARARELAGEAAPLPLERFPRGSGLAARLGLASTFYNLAPVPGVAREVAYWAGLRRLAVMAWSGAEPAR